MVLVICKKAVCFRYEEVGQDQTADGAGRYRFIGRRIRTAGVRSGLVTLERVAE